MKKLLVASLCNTVGNYKKKMFASLYVEIPECPKFELKLYVRKF